MLSAESAIGDFPVESVATMANIAEFTESHLDYTGLLRAALPQLAATITDAVSQGVLEMASDLGAAAILCATTSGQTARMVARLRPRMPIIAATSRADTLHRLPLLWDVRPLLVPPSTTTNEELTRVVNAGQSAGWVKSGDTVVVTLGKPVGTPGQTNLVKVQVI